MPRQIPDLPLSRRDVLKGIAGATALTAGFPLFAQSSSGSERVDCIVLGAGISGVTAARDLHRAGYRVLLLEGSQRIGGRMNSIRDWIRHPDYRADPAAFPLEAGAEYVHIGDKKRYSRFFEELDEHGFERTKYPKVSRNRLAFADWRRNPKKLLLALLREANLIPTVTLLAEIADFSDAMDLPAGEYISTKSYRGKGLRLARYTLSSHTPGRLYDPAIDRFEPGRIPSCAPGNEAFDSISVAGFQADQLAHQLFYEQSEWKLRREHPAGSCDPCAYDELPKAIAGQLLDPGINPRGHRGEILFGQRVTRVERVRQPGGGIVITTETAAGERREFEARSAVCTFSVGMLDPVTGEGDRIFGDLLTPAKRTALESVKMGPITKFSLEFKKSFWGRKNRMTVMSHPEGCARTFFSAFPDRRQGPFVLTGLLMNQDHRIIRDLDDAAAVQHVLDVLQSLLDPRAQRRGDRWTPEKVLVPRAGDPSEPNFNRQDWEKDEFSRGANSYISYQSGVNTAEVSRLRANLRDPLETLPLFWAGEATAPAYEPKYQPLAVHGAYISGVGAARDVGDFLAAGASAEAFSNAFGDREMVRLESAGEPARNTLTVGLSSREASLLEEYARGRGQSDLEVAARELYRIGIYLQENEPKTLKAKPRPAKPAQSLELSFTAEEWERLQGYADRDTGGDVEAGVRALLLRALKTRS